MAIRFSSIIIFSSVHQSQSVAVAVMEATIATSDGWYSFSYFRIRRTACDVFYVIAKWKCNTQFCLVVVATN